MTAADEYQRVTPSEERDLRAAYERDRWAGEWNSLPTAIDRVLAAHVAHALAADPGVRAAVEREALERAVQAIRNDRPEMGTGILVTQRREGIAEGIDRAARIVRDLMPRKDGE